MFKTLFKVAQVAAVTGFLATASTTAFAERSQSISAGELYATTCFQCHGAEGKYVQGNTIPALAGYPADVMYSQLKAFQSGDRYSTIMQRHVMGYSDKELRAMSDYFATLKP